MNCNTLSCYITLRRTWCWATFRCATSHRRTLGVSIAEVVEMNDERLLSTLTLLIGKTTDSLIRIIAFYMSIDPLRSLYFQEIRLYHIASDLCKLFISLYLWYIFLFFVWFCMLTPLFTSLRQSVVFHKYGLSIKISCDSSGELSFYDGSQS